MSLLLSEEDVREVLGADAVIEAVEEGFRAYGEGRVNMPPKSYLLLDDGDFRAMYGEIKGFLGHDVCGLKWVNVHPNNPSIGLPTVMAKILLNDPVTGVELADMDGSFITDMRTGAAGAVAVKYLAREDASNIAFMGAGRQATTQLECIRRVRNILRVRVYDLDESRAEEFAHHASELGVADSMACGLEEALEDADILVSLTPSRKPVVSADLIPDGLHINAFGADAQGKQELDPAILRRARIYIDDWEQASHSGEINVPLGEDYISKSDISGSLGGLVTGSVEGRVANDDVTLFDSTGLIVQDLVTAYTAYRLCKMRGLGVGKQFLSRVPGGMLEDVYKRF
ncbi:MAG: ornithine cyclodeaminase family protein [Candidatus Altiarchaeales archaeon ex4484_2]|nr:MAG: ornithine cyclodeaminase family protein [Candidatus Altiarchaeales archaeon ex4484_2]